MVEIGSTRIIALRQRSPDGTLKPVLDEHGQPVTKVTSSEVWRITRHSLNGRFGRDRNRKLVVGLLQGDLLALRPQGTRQQVCVELEEVYEWVLHRRAMSAHMEKMRVRKAAKEEARRERAWKRKLNK